MANANVVAHALNIVNDSTEALFMDDRTEPIELTPIPPAARGLAPTTTPPAAPTAPTEPVVYQQRRRRILLPIILFAATCWSTYYVGSDQRRSPTHGLAYSAAVMFILLSHELGHFIQAHRYGVPASLPFFIPIPAPPIGTMGAVIAMQPGVGDRRSIFDIAITGPIAGLIPALIFSVIGLQWSEVFDTRGQQFGLMLGEPLLFKLLAWLTFGPLPEHHDIALHPIAFAGWVGIFITALNLFPIGQLDGGHILYALLLKKAHPIARSVLLLAAAAVILYGYWGWTLMIVLLMLMGSAHPPTADDNVPLGTTRTILGWAALAFLPIGFTPVPFDFGM
jgi:membrane-associated protease RseP (regulator of RpoE activity)